MKKNFKKLFLLIILAGVILVGSQVGYAEGLVTIQDTDSSFVYYNGVRSAPDSTTADNSSAKMINDSLNWNITYLKSDLSALKAGISYDVYFRVKVKHATPNPTGNAFKTAVWDNTYGTYVLSEKIITTSSTQDMVWKEYKIGTFKPNSGVNQLVFYVAGVNNVTQVSEIYVDYIKFVEHTPYTIEDSSFTLYNDSTRISDGKAKDNSAAVLVNGANPDWNVQAPIDSTKIEAGVPYKLMMVVYPQWANWDTSSGDVFGYLLYDNTTSSYVISPTIVRSTDWPVNLKFPIYFDFTHNGTVTLDPSHTYNVCFYRVNNAANFPTVRIDKVYLEKSTIDDNPSQSISAYPYKISPANGDGVNDTTDITYTLSSTQTIYVKIYNTGNDSLVRTLVDGVAQSGTNTVTWDGRNDTGQIVSNGLYVVKVSNSGGIIFKKNIEVITGVTLASPPPNTANNFRPRSVWFEGGFVPFSSTDASNYLTTTFTDIKNMNCNTVSIINMAYRSAAEYSLWMDQANLQNLKVIAMPDPTQATENEALANDEVAMYNKLSDLIAPIKTKSNLLNYYLKDEPANSLNMATKLKNMKRMLETIDPVHPTSITYNFIEAVSMHYSNQKTQSLLSDIYPAWEGGAVGNFKTGVWDFTDQMDYFNLQIRKDISNQAPYWMIVQAFGGTGVGWRNPTAAELRAMTYLSLGHNSKGIGYFTYQSEQGWKSIVNEDLSHTATYTACQTLFSEIASMESTIKNMRRIGNVATAYGGGIAGIYANGDVTTHEDTVTGDKYIVVVNRDCTNSLTISIAINRSKLGMDISGIQDVYTGSNIPYTTDATSYSINNLAFAPGEGKIIKLLKSAAMTTYTGQDSSFALYNGATNSNTDVSASDSKTAMKVVQPTNGWDFQWWWDRAQLTPGATYDLYAVVKIRYANDDVPQTNPYGTPPLVPAGNAFECGIYDVTAAQLVGSPVVIPSANMENMLWSTIKVGTFIPSQTNTQYVYVYPANNNSNIYAVYVDKFYFVRR